MVILVSEPELLRQQLDPSILAYECARSEGVPTGNENKSGLLGIEFKLIFTVKKFPSKPFLMLKDKNTKTPSQLSVQKFQNSTEEPNM
mgnify:CR=1 FL=1